MSFFEKLRAGLRNVAEGSKVKVEFGLPPKVQFEWDGKSINAMHKTAQIVSYEMTMCFTDQQICYDDLAYIDLSNLDGKFREAEKGFKEAALKIIDEGDPGSIHLAELFSVCVPIIADHRRILQRAPGPESLRIGAAREIPEMRSKIVPYMETLAAFLPSPSLAEGRLVDCIGWARSSMTPEQIAASQPKIQTD